MRTFAGRRQCALDTDGRHEHGELSICTLQRLLDVCCGEAIDEEWPRECERAISVRLLSSGDFLDQGAELLHRPVLPSDRSFADMFTQIVLLALSAMPSTFATPYAQTSAPPASLQTTILGIQTNINSLINDIVRSNTAAIQSDYSSAQSQLATLFTSLGFEVRFVPKPDSTSHSR